MAHWRKMFDGKYVGAWDLYDEDGNPRDLNVKIARIEKQQIESRRGTDGKPVVYLEGKEKPLILNVTNCQTIARLYGDNPREWVGRWITIYPTTTSTKDGDVPAIRVRPGVPKGRAATPASLPAVPPEPTEPGGEG